jgi:hypothetical protein
MQKGKVIIANGSPETRARLTNFRSQMKLKDPLKKITMGDSIDYAIEQAERVPELEKENRELKKRIKELEEVNNLKPDDKYFDSEEFNEEWDRVMAREERHEKRKEVE